MKYQILTVVAVGFLIAGCGGDGEPFGGESPADTGAVGGTVSSGGKGGGATGSGGTPGTGGAIGAGGATGGSPPTTGTGGGMGGLSGTYPACGAVSAPGGLEFTECTRYASAGNTLTGVRDGRICAICKSIPDSSPECTIGSGKYLCVTSCTGCPLECLAPGCK